MESFQQSWFGSEPTQGALPSPLTLQCWAEVKAGTLKYEYKNLGALFPRTIFPRLSWGGCAAQACTSQS